MLCTNTFLNPTTCWSTYLPQRPEFTLWLLYVLTDPFLTRRNIWVIGSLSVVFYLLRFNFNRCNRLFFNSQCICQTIHLFLLLLLTVRYLWPPTLLRCRWPVFRLFVLSWLRPFSRFHIGNFLWNYNMLLPINNLAVIAVHLKRELLEKFIRFFGCIICISIVILNEVIQWWVHLESIVYHLNIRILLIFFIVADIGDVIPVYHMVWNSAF